MRPNLRRQLAVRYYQTSRTARIRAEKLKSLGFTDIKIYDGADGYYRYRVSGLPPRGYK